MANEHTPIAQQTYADRYPEVAGRTLWCVDCGADCRAEDLDWGQHCPVCADWWARNPPPADTLEANDDQQ